MAPRSSGVRWQANQPLPRVQEEGWTDKPTIPPPLPGPLHRINSCGRPFRAQWLSPIYSTYIFRNEFSHHSVSLSSRVFTFSRMSSRWVEGKLIELLIIRGIRSHDSMPLREVTRVAFSPPDSFIAVYICVRGTCTTDPGLDSTDVGGGGAHRGR